MSRTKRSIRSRKGLNWGRSLAAGTLMGGSAFVVSVVLVGFGFFSYAKGFLASARFQRMVEEKLSEALKAEVDLGTVRWEGTSAFADRVDGQGREDSSFAKFALAGLRAELDLSIKQFKRRVWRVTEVAISQLDVVFSEAGRLPRTRAGQSASADADLAGAPAPGRSLLSQWIPRDLELDEVRTSTLNLYWESAESRAGATGMEAVIRPLAGNGGYAVKVRGGMIQGTQQKKLAIETLDLRWKDKDIFVREAKFRSDEGALVELEGDVGVGESGKPGRMQLDAKVSQLSIAQISPDRDASRVKGDLEIVARVEGDPADMKSSHQEGRITLRNGVVETWPVLQMLARFTGSKRFERIALRDGGGAKFVRENGRTVFSEIDFQSDGLARVTGDLAVEDGRLDGLLYLGLIPGGLSWFSAAEQKIFTESRDGLLWTAVRVSGTVDHPQHDLTGRLAEAGVEVVKDQAAPVLDAMGRILGSGNVAPGSEGAEAPKPAPTLEPLGKAVGEFLNGFLR